jgi:hypothetical protein
MVRKGAIAGTGSSTTFSRLVLLVIVNVFVTVELGERVTTELGTDHAIFGPVEDEVPEEVAVGIPISSLEMVGDGRRLASR